jgi:hypothetical protein
MMAEAMSVDSVTPEPCTNWHHTRRHYSVDLAGSKYRKGRQGKSLCRPGGFSVDVYDQESLDGYAAEYRFEAPNIMALQVCKNCARKAGLPQ